MFGQNTKSIRIFQTLIGFHSILVSLALSDHLKVSHSVSQSQSDSFRVSQSLLEYLGVSESVGVLQST